METPTEFFHGSSEKQQQQQQRHSSDVKTSDHFIIDDLLNFPNDDTYDDVGDVVNPGTSNDSSVITTAVDSSISSCDVANRCFPDIQFSHDLCVPYDHHMADELAWVAKFNDESFSSEDMETYQYLNGVKPRHDEGSETNQFEHEFDNRTNNPIFNTDMMVPGKARTKRSRAAPCNWTSRLLVLSQPSMGGTNATMSSESESDIASSTIGKKTVKAPPKKKEVRDNESHNGDGRRCLHCATDKTPQWRTGPLGPKTLCNACGVRYKSGRLVPEYRPASSPTFVLAKHSNSHRKVLELRRQKEMQSVHQQPYFHHPNMMFDISQGDDYLIHQHIGQDYRQLI